MLDALMDSAQCRRTYRDIITRTFLDEPSDAYQSSLKWHAARRTCNLTTAVTRDGSSTTMLLALAEAHMPNFQRTKARIYPSLALDCCVLM